MAVSYTHLNLSRIMRYITNTTETTVTLKDELDYVQKYLYCMKVRYQSSLNYSIHVDESLLSQPVPKLIIQPIVENAIRYGSNCAPPVSYTHLDVYKRQLQRFAPGRAISLENLPSAWRISKAMILSDALSEF